MTDTVEIKDVYFRRFLVPIIICILIFFMVYVIISSSPTGDVDWATFNSVYGAVGGGIRKVK
jgi:hypothetical protein